MVSGRGVVNPAEPMLSGTRTDTTPTPITTKEHRYHGVNKPRLTTINRFATRAMVPPQAKPTDSTDNKPNYNRHTRSHNIADYSGGYQTPCRMWRNHPIIHEAHVWPIADKGFGLRIEN